MEVTHVGKEYQYDEVIRLIVVYRQDLVTQQQTVYHFAQVIQPELMCHTIRDNQRKTALTI
jgi:hypothetical protein